MPQRTALVAGTLVFGVALAVLLLGPDGDDEAETTRSYPSAQALGEQLQVAGVGCHDLAEPRSGIERPYEDVMVCTVENVSATLHVFSRPENTTPLPELTYSAWVPPPPPVYWVLGPNWFVATDGKEAAEAIARAAEGSFELEQVTLDARNGCRAEPSTPEEARVAFEVPAQLPTVYGQCEAR